MSTMDGQVPGRGLGDHLRQKGAAMRQAAVRKPDAEMWQETIAARCRADDITGVRKLTIRDFGFIGDGGPDIGGYNLGPTSPELFLGVISTCLAHTILCLAAWDEIDLDLVDVNVTASNNDANFFHVGAGTAWTPQGIAVSVRLRSADTAQEDLDELARRAEATCPVMQLLRAPVAIAYDVA